MLVLLTMLGSRYTINHDFKKIALPGSLQLESAQYSGRVAYSALRPTWHYTYSVKANTDRSLLSTELKRTLEAEGYQIQPGEYEDFPAMEHSSFDAIGDELTLFVKIDFQYGKGPGNEPAEKVLIRAYER
jgi:hypothetical protein